MKGSKIGGPTSHGGVGRKNGLGIQIAQGMIGVAIIRGRGRSLRYLNGAVKRHGMAVAAIVGVSMVKMSAMREAFTRIGATVDEHEKFLLEEHEVIRDGEGEAAEPVSPPAPGFDRDGNPPSGEVSSVGDGGPPRAVNAEETKKPGGKVSNTYPPIFRAKPGESYRDWRRSVDFWLGGEGHQIPVEYIGPRIMVQLRDRAAQLVRHLQGRWYEQDLHGPGTQPIGQAVG